ncbi:MAG: hypothetical protein GKR89_37805 [Candidatus Latescibacteria bacterium]|nr:hypothetical protein [Candidatus Latescibacterota bacterium]
MSYLLIIGVLFMAANGVNAQTQEGPFTPQSATLRTLANAAERAQLEKPGTVIFADDFSSDSSWANYFEIRGLDDGRAQWIAAPNDGGGFVQFSAPAADGRSSGSGASLWLGTQGYETVYYRRYIKFAADYDQGNLNHTGGGLSGVAGSNKWGGMGNAGIRPEGNDRFTAAFEPWRDWQRYPAPGYMFIYTYWMDMVASSDGNYWGNFIEAPQGSRIVLERDRWYCLEQMIRVNQIGQADGEMAAWIDGQLYLHYKGFRWRTAPDVKIKRADLGIYIHEAQRDNTVWYDDVVLSTGYVGPVEGKTTQVEGTSWGRVKGMAED